MFSYYKSDLRSTSWFFDGLVPKVHDEAEGADAQGQKDANDDGGGDAGPLRVVHRLGCCDNQGIVNDRIAN